MSEAIEDGLCLDAIQLLDKAAQYAIIDDESLERLRQPETMLHVSIPVRMDDGSLRIFRGYRVRKNDAWGPGQGGDPVSPRRELGVCADGGCRTPGDVVKTFAAGADFVMLGSMLAAHDECEGEWIEEDGKRISMKFYGMSSRTAMDKYPGGRKDYRACEGKEVLVPCRGPVKETIQEITGGIRSACAYVGASRLKDLSKCTTFVTCHRTHNTIYES